MGHSKKPRVNCVSFLITEDHSILVEKRDNNLIRSCKKFFDRFKSGQQSLKELLPAVEYDTSYDSILTLVKKSNAR